MRTMNIECYHCGIGALVKSFLSLNSPVVVIDAFSKPILELFINQMQGHSLISIIRMR